MTESPCLLQVWKRQFLKRTVQLSKLVTALIVSLETNCSEYVQSHELATVKNSVDRIFLSVQDIQKNQDEDRIHLNNLENSDKSNKNDIELLRQEIADMHKLIQQSPQVKKIEDSSKSNSLFIRMMKHQRVQMKIPFKFLQSLMPNMVEIRLLMDSSRIVFARKMVTPTQY